MRRKNKIRFRVYILGLYLLVLPIDATLGNIIGSISAINYIVIFYSAIRFFNLFREKIKIRNIKNCGMPFVYVIYFMISISWAVSTDLSSWYIFSLLGSFMMFLFASVDIYSNDEYRFLRNMIVGSGILVVIITLLNLKSSSRFVLNIGRKMDPNYFATGFILITAILMDNILNKKRDKVNMLILAFLILVIMMTGSRGGLLANVFVIFTSVFIYKTKQIKKLSLFLSGLMGFGLIFYFAYDFIPDWVLNRFSINGMTSGGGSGRVTIWISNLSYFKDMNIFRLIFGTGFATFSYISLISLGIPKVAHSIYVQALIEGGIVGFLITISLIMVALRQSWKNNERYVLSVLAGAVIGGIFLDIHISRFFWMILFFSMLTLHGKPNRAASPEQ